ncbi:Clp protease N-terminal domain-containing protein [Actinomadura kijaniata]|uniref:Clp protease N-terminal domain-containing protein n=1 Tax=Actinomadura kijaniata TaxID=46161 RepID=UPI00082D288E|nr:Clp protease N-terminal domain-containing protein [Actinomadura kijaniata]
MRLPRPMQDVKTMNALLNGAERHALEAGENVPGPEHLLLSALALPDGSARRAFQRVGAEPDGLRAAIDQVHAEALAMIGVRSAHEQEMDEAIRANPPRARGVMKTTATAQEAFQAATKQAKADRSALLGAHFVAAVAELKEGTAPRALRAMGIDPSALAHAARQEIHGD